MSQTARFRCNVSSELCCPGAKRRNWARYSLHASTECRSYDEDLIFLHFLLSVWLLCSNTSSQLAWWVLLTVLRTEDHNDQLSFSSKIFVRRWTQMQKLLISWKTPRKGYSENWKRRYSISMRRMHKWTR